jgi:hypothetical protein
MDPDNRLSKRLLKRYDPLFKEFQKTTISSEIAQEAEKKKEKATLPPEYSEFSEIFEKKATDHVPPSRSFDHAIDLDKDFVPKVAKVYPLNPKESDACKEFIKEHLETGKISPSKSPQASPFFFVPKKDRSLCPCQDYRYLNSHTVKNAYPLPLISDLIDKLKGSKIFTKFDIRWGYNNVQIKPGDRWKVAFITPHGLFEPNIMFFGAL